MVEKELIKNKNCNLPKEKGEKEKVGRERYISWKTKKKVSIKETGKYQRERGKYPREANIEDPRREE